MNSFERRVWAAAGIYGMLREPAIGGVKRLRVVKLFVEAITHDSCPTLMTMPRVTKDELFILLTVARLNGAKLPAPLTYFKP